MEDKREFTTEELEAQHKELIKQSKILEDQIKKQKQKEEDERKAKLAAIQDGRKKEVDEAFVHYQKLLNEYVKDFGSYSLNYNTKDDDCLERLLPWWF